ncbi:hypothetical protein V5J73_00500 [Flavobacterium sp. KS-LB2]|uniref:hypothetical protein n=1 Tax=Flavobacterium sp. KS-LB2 TaxID=3120525 RepID=UPI0030D1016B
MDIKYNQTTASIEIKDGLKNHFFIVKLLLIITFINAVLNLSNPQVAFGFMKLIWLIIGMIAAFGLRNYFFRKTGLDKITVDQIVGIKERVSFNKIIYFIQLKNGKTRDLLEVKSESQFKEVKKLLAEISSK